MAGTVAYGEAYVRGDGWRKEPWTAQVVAGGVQVTYEDEPGSATFSGSRGEHLPGLAQLLSQYCGDLLLADGRWLLRWIPTIRMEPELVGTMPGQITAICPEWALAGDSRGNIRLWSIGAGRRGNSYPRVHEMGLTAPIVSLDRYDIDGRGTRAHPDPDTRLLVGVPDEVLVVDFLRSAIQYSFPVAAPPRLLVSAQPLVAVGGDQGVLLHDISHARETVLLPAADVWGQYRPTALAHGVHHILAAVRVTDPAGDDAGTELFRWDWSGKFVRRERVAPPQSAEVVHIVPRSSCTRKIMLIDSAGAVREASA